MKKLFFLLILFPLPLRALTPPWSPDELKRGADLIVKGEVEGEVQCVGLFERTRCADILKYVAPLNVQKVLKGKVSEGDTLKVFFFHYDYSKSHCTGDQETSLLPGDVGTYYLIKMNHEGWRQIHWSGVIVSQPGKGPLPKCP